MVGPPSFSYAAEMLAPNKFAAWTSTHVANDRKFGRKVFRYHPRSDTHSKMLCNLVFEDLLVACPTLASHISRGDVVGVINAAVKFPNGKTKTLDLAVGEPAESITSSNTRVAPTAHALSQLRISCEAKQCMTEHSKKLREIWESTLTAGKYLFSLMRVRFAPANPK